MANSKTKTKKASTKGGDPHPFAGGRHLVYVYAALVALTALANFVNIPIYVHMLADTVLIIYIGAHFSVHNNEDEDSVCILSLCVIVDIRSSTSVCLSWGFVFLIVHCLEHLHTRFSFLLLLVLSPLSLCFLFPPLQPHSYNIPTHKLFHKLFPFPPFLLPLLSISQGMEQMSSKDAYMFPFIGSAFLFGLYLVFKFLPKDYVNMCIKAYFFLFGVLVLAACLYKVALLLLPKKHHKGPIDSPLFRVKIPFVTPDPSDDAGDGKTPFSTLDLICYFLAGVVGYWYIATNHWAASNAFGIAFSIQGIEFLSLGSFFNGAILLCGLFVYDVFWVFGTDVMVTVAKSFDAPIKLLFPRPDMAPSLLGLGDIVIPGIFIALLLRFDFHLAKQKNKNASITDFPKFYFYSVMVGYFVGLSTTFFVMFYFEAAQPALLYLVPTCLGSAVGAAVYKGQLKELTSFSEAKDEETVAKKES